MGGINIPDNEKKALKAIDESELRKLIDQAVDDEHIGDLSRISLSSCGTYVASELKHFRKAIDALREAKSAQNIENKRSYAMRAGMKLSHAVSLMIRRMETEEKEGELFHVDDHVYWPSHFTKSLHVRISFKWRRTVADDWTHGSISFHHKVRPRPEYAVAPPKRKPSAWKQAEEEQYELGQTWEYFMRDALFSVRDFFREGGDGTKIPETFQAVADPHSGQLNNFSLIFWQKNL